MPLPAADRVAQGLAEGWVTRKRRERPGDAAPVTPSPGPSTTALLTEDRGE
jgi:hypothetical protein